MEKGELPSSLFDWDIPRPTPRQTDWLLFCLALAVSLSKLTHDGSAAGVVTGLAMTPFATLPLLWRRNRPGPTLGVVAIVFAISIVLSHATPGTVAMVFAIYAAASYGAAPTRMAAAAAAVLATAIACAMWLATGRAAIHSRMTLAAAVAVGAACLFGEATRARRLYLAQVDLAAAQVAREHDEHVRRAALEERMRIARDLHDVVTHNVSVIAIHAGATRATDESRDALVLIQQTARSTLSELRSLLGVLRATDSQEPPPVHSDPSLSKLQEILTQARAAGVQVTLHVDGTPVHPDAVVELAAYRVIQEALTNVAKHASGARARVQITYAESELCVRVSDDGGSASGPSFPGGHGLIGMRERVELAGGLLDAGADGDGFRVEARLPLDSVASRHDASGALSLEDRPNGEAAGPRKRAVAAGR